MSEGRLPIPVVLASASPERRRLLEELIADFEVVVPPGDEMTEVDGGPPEAIAVRRAEKKAAQVADSRPESLVIGADTVVECQGEILGKPADLDDARRMLGLLTTNPQRVISGMVVITPTRMRVVRVESVELEMREFSAEDIEEYLEKDPDALERAGAYGLEPDDPNVTRIQGNESAVRGLPVERLEETLEDLFPGWVRRNENADEDKADAVRTKQDTELESE